MSRRVPGGEGWSVAVAVLLAATFVLTWSAIGAENDRTRTEDWQRRYAEVTSQPIPTVTVKVTAPPKTLPPKTVKVTVRVTERATERASRSSTRAPSGPLTGWKARYWTEGQAWARQPKTRAVIMCESTDRVSAISSTGKYHGLYQFDRQTWASYGGLELAPLASQATRAEQNYVAYRLYVGRGWQPWGCAA